jgi:RND superfamily putative drug exporter
MFAWWGRIAVRARWTVLAVGVAFAVFGGVWGTGVFGAVSGSGFETPGSESDRAAHRIVEQLGRQNVDVLVLYSSESATVDDPAFANAVTGVLGKLHGRPEVRLLVTYYETHSPALVSTDRHATYVGIQLSSFGNINQLKAIRGELAADGLRTQIGGPTAINADVSGRVGKDIGMAEGISMPILLVLLILVFRSAVAATTPLLVGGLAILGAFTATRVLTYLTDVSVFSLNIITLIGLGMAVDYALFIVSRFREELTAGRSVAEAVERSVATAGRTVAFSGLTVALALASLLLFPQGFLRSMGFGGMAAVLVAMIGALTVLPALLAVLGPRINALRVPLPGRRRAAVEGAAEGAGWAGIARAVMRRPVLFVLGTVAVLAVLTAPFLHVTFGGIDERVEPAGTESRVVSERLRAEFAMGGADHLDVLITGADQAGVQDFAARAGRLPNATSASVLAIKDHAALVSVGYKGESGGRVARDLVDAVRALPAPSGAEVLVGGAAAQLSDLLDSLAARLPWMGLVVAAVTALLLFIAFGSVLLPVKAIVMNVVSIGASFGVVVWAFQDGHLAGLLGFTSTGYLEASQLILMLAILFGLSTDYEVFLLSRVREEWDRTGDNTAAVAGGLAKTGRIITSAALLLIIVIGGFSTSGITFIKMIGVGMIAAILVDATIVRALLVPATMRLMGRANWWTPGPLRRLYARYGIREGEAGASAAVPAPEPVAP